MKGDALLIALGKDPAYDKGKPKSQAGSDKEMADKKARMGRMMMQAMKSGDEAKFTSSLEEFVHACMEGYGP